MNMTGHPRRDIYYWKCDRPAAFHGLGGRVDPFQAARLQAPLKAALSRCFADDSITLRSGMGQGNHITFEATIAGRAAFVRVENGPDSDDNMEVEAQVLRDVASIGVPVPEVLAVDATRAEVPFAWQVLERIPYPDLNQLLKEGQLDLSTVGFTIGAFVARWQAITPTGYGPFDIAGLREGEGLRGYHETYARYFWLRLDSHLSFLAAHELLTRAQTNEIRSEIEQHAGLLEIGPGCLVHKDLALWNVLGDSGRIAAFIDWDDAVSGDPMDDLSLLACFHDGYVLERVFEGYRSVRPLPQRHRTRFWLHLLRNMIFKAVIRVGAGYFDRTENFFLIGAGSSGTSLRVTTLARIAAALKGLREETDPLKL